MTIKFSAGETPPVDVLAITETWLMRAADDLASTIKAIRDGHYDRACEAEIVVKDLAAAMQCIVNERSRVEKLRKQVTGTVGAERLDFHAARDEIGRRLARLRDAGAG